MSRLSDLLRQVGTADPALAKDIQREVDALADRRAFGLNFERHVPEAVELPGRKVRKGDKVHIQPERGKNPTAENDRLWRVTAIERDASGAIADLEDAKSDDAERRDIAVAAVEDLVVVAEFRDPIYPGLVSTGKVERGGDKPFHTVINAENFHALQTLLFTHRGKVDCIYIDPPYNTGARDWKYNNDYVEGDDLYRHSKWLAFMERRLLLAKELLNPDDSVLIVAIDENEGHRLGLLLEQVFPESFVQTVTDVINPSGASGLGFSRVEEYLLFVWIGSSMPARTPDNLLTDVEARDGRVRGGLSWESFLRSGVGNTRAARPNLCYPVLIDLSTQRIVGAGQPLEGPEDARPDTVDGYAAAWPVRNDGSLGMWRRDRAGLLDLLTKGYVFVSGRDDRRNTWSMKYLLQGTIAQIESGEIEVSRSGDAGEVIAISESLRLRTGKTVWNRPSHNAGKHGTDLLGAMLPGRRFPFPKSLYAVEDAIRYAVATRPRAVVLDFFAGSGTTAHAVMRLNKQDGGQRTSISVTNNEVSADEQARLQRQRLRPGDPGWEQNGICEYVTKPRIDAAITGVTPDGRPIRGDYRFTDEFPMAEGLEENAEFFTLTYESPLRVTSNREFVKIAPLLWIRAGSRGRRIADISAGWDVSDTYGVLVDLDQSESFLRAVAARDALSLVYIVTDEDRLFEAVVRELPEHVEPVRLYEAYLRNFEIETDRSAL